MAIMKSKEMNWKSYVRALAESQLKLSDIDKLELSGYLLRRDLTDGFAERVMEGIFSQGDYEIADVISSFLIAESPDTAEDLHMSMKNLVVDYYNTEINELIADEIKLMKEEYASENPNDEYDSNYHMGDGA